MATSSRIAVAIDGPMGSGKSTVAREVARRLGFRYVDTGAMYRAVAAAALRRGVSVADPAALAEVARGVSVTLEAGPDAGTRIAVDGDDVTADLRTVAVNRVVGKIAGVPGVRAVLVDLQRALGAHGGVVMDGRDVGSVILPHAEVKIYLTASADARARRRQAELASAGEPVSIEDVRRIEADDDRAATTRAVGPLRVAPDAVVIDSTDLTVDQVVDRIVSIAERRRGL